MNDAEYYEFSVPVFIEPALETLTALRIDYLQWQYFDRMVPGEWLAGPISWKRTAQNYGAIYQGTAKVGKFPI